MSPQTDPLLRASWAPQSSEPKPQAPYVHEEYPSIIGYEPNGRAIVAKDSHEHERLKPEDFRSVDGKAPKFRHTAPPRNVVGNPDAKVVPAEFNGKPQPQYIHQEYPKIVGYREDGKALIANSLEEEQEHNERVELELQELVEPTAFVSQPIILAHVPPPQPAPSKRRRAVHKPGEPAAEPDGPGEPSEFE